jgi:hypothetical protein
VISINTLFMFLTASPSDDALILFMFLATTPSDDALKKMVQCLILLYISLILDWKCLCMLFDLILLMAL